MKCSAANSAPSGLTRNRSTSASMCSQSSQPATRQSLSVYTTDCAGTGYGVMHFVTAARAARSASVTREQIGPTNTPLSAGVRSMPVRESPSGRAECANGLLDQSCSILSRKNSFRFGEAAKTSRVSLQMSRSGADTGCPPPLSSRTDRPLPSATASGIQSASRTPQ